MVAQIKKRSGQTEEFDRSKLESSLLRAGASVHVAHELVGQVAIREGLSTSELRSQVLSALRTKDAEAAERYERTRCCRADGSSDVAKDVVRINPKTLKHLGLSRGSLLQLEHDGKTHSLQAEESSNLTAGQVLLNSEVLRSLRASPETKLALRRA